MSLIPEISNPYLGAFTGGLLYGLVVCTASCLPIVTSYIAGIGAGFSKGVKITLIFNSGRILAYALIGGLIGLFSGLFRLFVSDAAISPFQIYSSLAFGVVTIIIGAIILLKAKKPCDCNVQDTKNMVATPKTGRFGFDFGAFSLGLSRGLIMCPPLIALLIYSLPFSNPVEKRRNSSLVRVRNRPIANTVAGGRCGVASKQSAAISEGDFISRWHCTDIAWNNNNGEFINSITMMVEKK